MPFYKHLMSGELIRSNDELKCNRRWVKIPRGNNLIDKPFNFNAMKFLVRRAVIKDGIIKELTN